MVQYTYTVLFCAELIVRMVALRWRLVENGHFRQMGRVDGKPNMMTWDPKAWYACVSIWCRYDFVVDVQARRV